MPNVKNTAQNLLNSNVNSAVILLLGSVGEQLTSVNHVIRDNVLEIMFQGKRERIFLSVQARKIVHLK